MIDFVVIQELDKCRKGREENHSKFTSFHGACCNCPGPSSRLREYSGALVYSAPFLHDGSRHFRGRVFKKALYQGLGNSLLAEVELLRRHVPNDGEVLTNIVQRAVTCDAFVIVGAIM